MPEASSKGCLCDDAAEEFDFENEFQFQLLRIVWPRKGVNPSAFQAAV
jgi:hypothetical protein